ncbi:MAG: DUF1801 domain-containing protein [Bacteroidetes bacterium]|nr:DUF1801 domain-containing protein [Bacteroidota bacterium]
MSDLKTKPNKQSVKQFLEKVTDKNKRGDCYTILKLMKQVTKEEPKMWGNNIVVFGSYHYKYESGREGDWFVTGFFPRKQNLTIYIMVGFEQYPDLMKKLGKHKTGKSCLYINRLEDINQSVLKELIAESVKKLSKISAKE